MFATVADRVESHHDVSRGIGKVDRPQKRSMVLEDLGPSTLAANEVPLHSGVWPIRSSHSYNMPHSTRSR